ncbi:hypothetical protein AAIA72_10970 [Hahella sp. SMD15-11]|uniref:Cation transporter n=1 Tax=Thermohahella caldifontis TaxID=3142973 RepID=A0AB39UT86_9GAMM
MSKTTHKTSVNPAHLVKRSLRVQVPSESAMTRAIAELNEDMGVDRVEWIPGKSRLTVIYDASFRSLENIEAILQHHGIQWAPGWWNQKKRNWYASSDADIKENLKAEPHCCSKMPPGY